MMANIGKMQKYTDVRGWLCGPHTKTHKAPYLAKLQRDAGCKGITVAKSGRSRGLWQKMAWMIFLLPMNLGDMKLKRILKLMETKQISFGVDCPEHVGGGRPAFCRKRGKHAQVVVEIRSRRKQIPVLLREAVLWSFLTASRGRKCRDFLGVFSHEGTLLLCRKYGDCRRKVYCQPRNVPFIFAQLAKG